ncbi:MAG TPA: ABC transporter ATP-binding protein [Chloroflexi bacterium]|nr:ABC transporter ATP-binding protein [Chloroflexota bacterium]
MSLWGKSKSHTTQARNGHAIQPGSQSNASSFLRYEGISARYISHLGQLEALEQVSLDVARGEFVCLIGPSGCGKSTLLRITAGLLRPTQGQVLLAGQPQIAPNRRVGFVFQDPTLLPWRTVWRNVSLPLEILGLSPEEIHRRTRELLELVDLVDFAHEFPANLSGGMAQRAALARALAQQPELLLLDEPFASLDALTRERMAEEFLRIWERDHRTVLMVTHNVEEAALLADRVVVLSPRPGRITEIVQVPIARPRSLHLLGTPVLQNVAQHLREALARGSAST